MHNRYLEVTFRKGKPLAAYLYLGKAFGRASIESRPVGNGLIVDIGSDGLAIGLEITAPGEVSLADVNKVLQEYGLAPLSREELAPLQAA